MAYTSAGREAVLGAEAHRYERHRPEQTLLYQLVEEHYPAFVAALAAEGREVPAYVAREFEEYLKCGRLEHGWASTPSRRASNGKLSITRLITSKP